MAKQISRLYTMEDEVLTVRAQTIHDNMIDDMAAFTAKFPWIDAAYAASLQTDITTANTFPRDESVLTDLKVLTDDVQSSMAEARLALKVLYARSISTYPDNEVKQRVFGQDQLDKARSDEEKMFRLLEHAHSFANKNPYKPDLLANGYTQVEIDNLHDIADNINTKNGLQEEAKTDRPVTTYQRITVHNILFKRLPIIRSCAIVVWPEDTSKQNQYLVYPPSGTQQTTLTVNCVLLGTSTPAAGVTVSITNLPAVPPKVSDVGGHVDFGSLGSTPPDSVDLHWDGAGYLPGDLTQGIVEGSDNVITIEVEQTP